MPDGSSIPSSSGVSPGQDDWQKVVTCWIALLFSSKWAWEVHGVTHNPLEHSCSYSTTGLLNLSS